jgi:hypothetical protein
VKKVVAIFLLLLFCGKFIYTTTWLVYFHINQREIVRLSCENRNRPALKCNGKCYLAKQLRKAEVDLAQKNNDQQTQLKLIKQLELEGFFISQNVQISEQTPFLVQLDLTRSRYNSHFSNAHLNKVFHPPCA